MKCPKCNIEMEHIEHLNVHVDGCPTIAKEFFLMQVNLKKFMKL